MRRLDEGLEEERRLPYLYTGQANSLAQAMREWFGVIFNLLGFNDEAGINAKAD